MKKWWTKIMAVPVIVVKAQRNTKRNLDRAIIKLGWKGILKLLIHRKIVVVVSYYPLILSGKAKMNDNGDGTFTMTMENENYEQGSKEER